MSEEVSRPPAFNPPMSAFGGPIAELVNQQMLAPPTRPGLMATLDRYEILRMLGGGGMGTVLLARDTQSDKNVAIKMVKAELLGNQQVIHRFVKEAGHLQKLRHTNIVPVLEVNDRKEGPYFVMPYFEQGSLARRIQPGRPLDVLATLEIARHLASGLEFAHRRGIIHRDLKPANVLLDAKNAACLADFGLARTLFNDSIIDVERQPLEGTAPYMSPGVAAGHAEDTRCDIYAFGALLYEMLTGDPPYVGATNESVRRQILDGPPVPVATRNPTADPALTTVAEGAMARELRDRYADMTDIVSDLQRIKDGKAPVGPRGLVRESLRQARRIPPVVWAGGALAAVALLIWSLFSGGKVPVREEKSRATNAIAVAMTNPIVVTTAPVAVIPTNVVKIVPPVTPTNPPATVPPGLRLVLFAGEIGTSGGRDGPALAARFRAPGAVAADANGNVYVADTGNNTIRKIDPAGNVTTLAGKSGAHGGQDGPGATARFWAPFGIAVDSAGNLCVAEVANNTVRQVFASGQTITLAGLATEPGGADGTGIAAQFRNPWGIALDKAGNAYVTDMSNFTIRKITPQGKVSTLAGQAGSSGSGDGPGQFARFWDSHGIAADEAGNLYVADTGNDSIRKITPQGEVTTLAGLAASPGAVDGVGAMARFRNPEGIAVDKTGNVYVADTDNHAIRKIVPGGLVSTLQIAAADAPNPPFDPSGITVAPDGAIFVADAVNNVIWKITGEGLQ
jgi:serine/threonine protein kinase/DNA-binding beta-propeller fold protein YncE